jgi:hypothetical protein
MFCDFGDLILSSFRLWACRADLVICERLAETLSCNPTNLCNEIVSFITGEIMTMYLVDVIVSRDGIWE